MKKLFPLILLMTGCDGIFDDWQPQQLENEGAVCLVTDTNAPSDAQVFDASTPITVIYDANTCLSSSCDRNAEASVEASITDDSSDKTIAIISSASWEANMGENVACTDDCGFLGAESELGALAEGEYTVTYGGQSLTLTIPGEQSACFGELYY